MKYHDDANKMAMRGSPINDTICSSPGGELYWTGGMNKVNGSVIIGSVVHSFNLYNSFTESLLGIRLILGKRDENSNTWCIVSFSF